MDNTEELQDLANHRAQGNDFNLDSEKGISPEDKQEILESIKKLMEASSTDVDRKNTFKPKKRGFLVPLVVVVGAACLIVAAFFGFDIYFRAQKSDIVIGEGGSVSTEGAILEQVKLELEAKNAQIQDIKNNLTSLDKQTKDLQANFSKAVGAEKDKLEGEMSKLLEQKRKELEGQGMSFTDVDAQLKKIQTEVEAKNATQIKTFEQQQQAALKAKEDELAAVKSETQKALSAAQQEQQKKQTEYNTQNDVLQKQLAAATNQSAQIQDQLASMQKMQSDQKLQAVKENQINLAVANTYKTVLSNINAGALDQAESDLKALSVYIQSTEVKAIPGMAERLQVQSVIISAFTDVIRDKRASSLGVVAAGSELEAAQKKLSETAKTAEDAKTSAAKALAKLKEKEKELTTNQDSLKTKETQIKTLETQLSQSNQTYRQELDKLKVEYDKQLTALSGTSGTASKEDLEKLKKNYEDKIAAMEKDYQKQLDAAKASGGTGSAEVLAQLKDKEKQLKSNMDSLKEKDAKIKTLENQLESSDKSYKNEIEKLKKDYDKRIAELTTGGNAASQAELEKIKKDYQAQLDDLNSKVKTQKADLEKQLKDYETRIAALNKEYQSKIDETTKAQAAELAKKYLTESEIKAMMTFLISSKTGGSAKMPKDVQAKIDANPALKKVFVELADMIDTQTTAATSAYTINTSASGTSDTPLKTVQYRLLGLVSYVSGNTAYMEMDTIVNASIGQPVVFRKASGSTESDIAEGSISAIKADIITITINSGFTEKPINGTMVFMKIIK